MRVHIVTRDWTSERIIPRLAGALVAGTGWSAGPQIDPRAVVNLAFPYLEMPAARQRGSGLLAAEFSHRETTVPAKVKAWDALAGAVDLRLTWATLYADMLAPHGLTRTVTPPLDREKFRPAPYTWQPQPASTMVVGVSGWVYKGGRKGEHLVARLHREGDALGVAVVATGEGWPCPVKRHTWADLHEFYWHLDAYLVTSTIEGIPYPPLEALASGVPIIVPTGVGMMDELPDLPGIARYPAGDYGAMVGAIRAIDAARRAGIIDREALRAATERFTMAAWVGDHVRAVAELVNGPDAAEDDLPAPSAPIVISPATTAPAVPSTPIDFQGKAGVYMVAYGDPARACAERAIASIRRHMPGLPVCLVSDRPLAAGEAVFVEQPDTDVGARGAKTRIYDLAPAEWERVLYLDADTELVAPIDSLFAILADGWDLIFAPNPTKYVLASAMRRPDNGDEMDYTTGLLGTDELVQFNGGVFGFRRSEVTAAFCRGWHEEWQRYGKRDQAALDRVLYAAPLRVWTLSSEFNRIDRYDDPTPRTAIVHHPTQARRHTGRIAGRLDSDEAWMAVGVRGGRR